MWFKLKIKSHAIDRVSNELHEQNKILKSLVQILTPQKAARILFYVDVRGTKIRTDHMILKVSDSQAFTIAITDKFGNPAKVDGAPAWAVTDQSLGGVVADADGMSATLTPVGPVGSFKVQVTADADLGEGVVTILGEAQIDLIAGDAVSIVISPVAPAPAPIPPQA
ncbi:MAG: hypothetical protein ACHQUC_01245 [Chlamydiales bacterium]